MWIVWWYTFTVTAFAGEEVPCLCQYVLKCGVTFEILEAGLLLSGS